MNKQAMSVDILHSLREGIAAAAKKTGDVALQVSSLKPYVAIARDAAPSFHYHINQLYNNSK